MIHRENGLERLEDILKPLKASEGLKYFKRNPSRTVTKEQMPCVLITEGEDVIIKRSQRDFFGYPLQRRLEVVVEVWKETPSTNVKALRTVVVDKIMEEAKGGILISGVALQEVKTNGPFNLGIPGVHGMQIIYNMIYKETKG